MLYVHLIFLFLRGTHFAPFLRRNRAVATDIRAYIGISSYREPFYLMYDPANAIDKTAHLSLTLYGDRLSRSAPFFFPPCHRRGDHFDPRVARDPTVAGKAITCILFSLHRRDSERNDRDRRGDRSPAELTIPFVDGVNLSPVVDRMSWEAVPSYRYPGIKFEENHY